MIKKYIVRLTDAERAICDATVKTETGKSENLRRAMILLKADADGCRTRTTGSSAPLMPTLN